MTWPALLKSDLDPDPVAQFKKWFDAVLDAGLKEPYAMTLATASRDGAPSARMVLLKGVDEAGFVFFTNYESRKGRELGENPRAALVFFWTELERQVRVTGTVERTSREESQAYWDSRPRGSRLGALASKQSSVVQTRAVLEQKLMELDALYPSAQVPLPDYWGGFRVKPMEIEFWQGRPNRLHDRLIYRRNTDATWRIGRLSP